MSLKGGYQIIDLKSKPFDSREGTSHTFPELFDDLKNSNAKMIIISGLNMDGVKYNDYDVIFYEVEENNDTMYYQAVLRRIWTPIDYTCTTKYISVYNDDKVKITQDTFIYKTLPDDDLDDESTNAVQNKVITEHFTQHEFHLSFLDDKQLEYLKLDGSRKMTGAINMNSHSIYNLLKPSGNSDAANKKYVDDKVFDGIYKAKSNIVYSSFNEKQAEYRINITMPTDFSTMSIEIIPLKAMFTLDNSVSFNYVGLPSDIQARFTSTIPGVTFSKLQGSFRFPVNSIGEDMNIFGTIESSGETITIKFYGDITDIGSINTPIFCTVPLVPVAISTAP